MQRGQQRTIYAFYITGGLREIIPIYPLYAIMFGDHGVSPFELSLLFVIWALVGLTFEVPSGAWADRYSRKWLVVAGGIFKAAAFFAWYQWQEFWGYALGFALWGFGSSLRSGAFEALLHDLLRAWAPNQLSGDRFTYYYGRIRAIATLSVVVGEVLGGILIVHGYNFVLLISMLVPLIATIPFVLWVHDAPAAKSVDDSSTNASPAPSYLTYLQEGFMEARTNPAIRFIFLATASLLVAHGVFDEFESPLLFEQGFSLTLVALLAAPVYAAQALGEYLAGQFAVQNFGRLIRIMMLGTLFLLPIPWLHPYLVPVATGAFFLFFGFASTAFAGHLQAQIQGASRATITSLVGFAEGIGAIGWFLVFGLLAEAWSMTGATVGFGCLLIVFCLFGQRLLNRWQINPD